jgi:23S rRNA pseudouridine1911/1915/1917 synthase
LAAIREHAPACPSEARARAWRERTSRSSARLRLRLETGRTHQIRVHLAAAGLPVCGDPVYGAAGAFGLARQFLHSARIAFASPFGGPRIDVSSPLPPDLQAALARAERVS